ncbi:NfeD family protein [Cyanobium sp. LEGE 06143]|jgi:membrane protein implicated in regulation of membrane protease activity|uniref:NfeD family protein n=1 Tax=unclassified Cyanobium TaxID=2627006 RepID=UPI00164414AD|nr:MULTISPECIES: NfeD family protein [unclassified Cyanobium]MBE9173894.1 NfeD family protein [Cyanobium sp. LEGE 06143]QNI69964.1 NfeD-like family protein YbbJ [Cyanobium sp. NS01]
MALASVIWLLVGLALLGLEGLGAEFDGLLEAAVAALVVSALSALLPWPPLLQVVTFAVLSGLGLLALRGWERRSRERSIPASGHSQRAAVISGFEGTAEGRVRWQGQSWAATNLETSRTLQPGSAVTVMGRDGNRLQVLPDAAPGELPGGSGH